MTDDDKAAWAAYVDATDKRDEQLTDAYAEGRKDESECWKPVLEALREALDFVADREDINDGPDGQPQANKAMQLAALLRAAIFKVTGEKL